MNSILNSTARLIIEHGIKWRSKILIDLDYSHRDYAEDFSIPNECVRKMKEVLEVLRKIE